MKCPGFEDLLNYCDSQVDERLAQLVSAHLTSGCQTCPRDIAWYQRVRGIAASDDCEDPPAWVLKRALRLFETKAQTRSDHFGRLLAALAFDSFARPVLSGVRLVETSNRQLLYRAGPYSLDLQINFSTPPGADLKGQILRESESRFESVAELLVQITREGQAVFTTATNAIGEFTVHHLTHNEYDLSVETKEGVIIVPQLPVRPDE